MSLNRAFQAFELSYFLSSPSAESCPILRCTERMCAHGVAWGLSVTRRSAQQQAHLKVASTCGEINPASVHVHSPSLQAHTSVSESSQVQSQVQTQDPCPSLRSAPEGLPRCACLVHWAISDSAPWTVRIVNPHTQAGHWLHSSLRALCSSFRASTCLGL